MGPWPEIALTNYWLPAFWSPIIQPVFLRNDLIMLVLEGGSHEIDPNNQPTLRESGSQPCVDSVPAGDAPGGSVHYGELRRHGARSDERGCAGSVGHRQ